MDELDRIAREEIMAAYKNNNTTISYFLDGHFSEYGKETTQEVFEKLNINKQDDIAFLENLELGGIVMISGDKEDGVCASLDYNIIWKNGISFTDQILAVQFNDEKKCISISHES